MNDNNYTSGSEHDTNEASTGNGRHIFVAAVLLVIAIALSATLYMYVTKSNPASMVSSENQNTTNDQNQHNSNNANNQEVSLAFSARITEGGAILRDQGPAEAVLYFNRLVNSATTPHEEGQAKFNLAIARLSTNQEAAVALLKEVSVNETHQPFTRTKAANYVLDQFTATKDETFAREHIFTGPLWSSFTADTNSTDIAVLNAFNYFAAISPTPEGVARAAVESAKQLYDASLSEAERAAVAASALEDINTAQDIIDSLTENNEIQYGGTHYSEIVVAYNRIGIVADILYFEGYLDSPTRAEDAFRAALDLLIENNNEPFGTELFVRYHYADLLLRLDSTANQNAIMKILAPTEKANANYNLITFIKGRILEVDINNSTPATAAGRPDKIAALTDISPEFKSTLLILGITEAELNQAR